MLDLSDPDAYAQGIPHQVFRELRAGAPVSRQVDRRGRAFWAVVRYHDIVSVLRDPATFSSALGGVLLDDPPAEFLAKLRENMLNRDPPDHTALRKLVNTAFSPRRLAQLEASIAAHCARLVDHALERGECDFATDVAGDLPLHVICEMLGVPAADRRRLYALTERMFGSTITDPALAFQDGMAAAAELRGYADQQRAEKLARPTDDLASELLAARLPDGEHLTAGEFQAFFMLLFNAGSDTTRTTLCYALDLLLDRPAELSAIAATPELVPQAVEEVLRYEPPVIQFRRTTTRDTELAGQTIPAHERVVVFFPSGNRDETVFADPDRFDIDRPRVPHLAFGYGTHFCLGAPLARMESKHLLLTLRPHLSRIERVAPPTYSRTAFIRSVVHQPIRFREPA